MRFIGHKKLYLNKIYLKLMKDIPIELNVFNSIDFYKKLCYSQINK